MLAPCVFACFSGVPINFAAGCQSTILASEALKPLLALLDSSAWASQGVAGEGGKFAFVDFAAEVASILLLSSADCGSDTNNKPRPIRLKLVRDATGIYKASFHCFAKVPVP